MPLVACPQVLLHTDPTMDAINAALLSHRVAPVQTLVFNNGMTSGRRSSVDFYLSTAMEQPRNDDSWHAQEQGLLLAHDDTLATRIRHADMAHRTPQAMRNYDSCGGQLRVRTAFERLQHETGGAAAWGDVHVHLAGEEFSRAQEMYTEALMLFDADIPISFVIAVCGLAPLLQVLCSSCASHVFVVCL